MKTTSNFAIASLASAALATAILAPAPAAADDEADKRVEQKVEVSEFSKIHLSGGFRGTIKVNGKPKLVLSGRQKDLDRTTTTVSGSKLKIKSKGRRNKGIEAEIVTKKLDELVIDGAGKFTITGVNSRNFVLKLPGASKISVAGKCETNTISISGAGKVNAKDFKCKDSTIKISGSAKISVHASRAFEAKVSGVGKIDVYGEPKDIDKSVSGHAVINLH